MSLLLALTAGGGGGDVTVALTGVAGAAAVGTVLPQTAAPVTGVAGATTVGTLTPATTTALAGAAGTTGQGAIAPVTAAPAAGVGGGLGQGVLAPSSSTSLTGVAATGVLDNLAVVGGDVTVALTGIGVQALAGTLTPVVTTNAASGVTRQWLVDYYTKAWERKPVVDAPAAVTARKGKARSQPAAPVAGVYPDTLDQVEQLAQRAETAVRKAARQIQSTEAVDAVLTQAQLYAVKSILPVMDFEPLLARYAAQAAARQQQEDEDDLALFSLVL